jgi:hypothetical protein
MEVAHLEEAIELVEKANVDLEPELLSGPVAKKLIGLYGRVGRPSGSPGNRTLNLRIKSARSDRDGSCRPVAVAGREYCLAANSVVARQPPVTPAVLS